MLGKLRLNDDRGLRATREPILSDLEMHIKRHKQMVETLRELFAPRVTEDFRSLSGNCCWRVKIPLMPQGVEHPLTYKFNFSRTK